MDGLIVWYKAASHLSQSVCKDVLLENSVSFIHMQQMFIQKLCTFLLFSHTMYYQGNKIQREKAHLGIRTYFFKKKIFMTHDCGVLH